MRHVDDGELHALLDGQHPAPAEAEAHLAACAECAARLEAERAVRERAHALLGLARPAERPAPAWDRIAARPAPAPAPRAARYRPLAAAAMVVVALGVGWLARDLARPDAPAAIAVRAERQQESAATAPVAPEADLSATEEAEESAASAPPAAPTPPAGFSGTGAAGGVSAGAEIARSAEPSAQPALDAVVTTAAPAPPPPPAAELAAAAEAEWRAVDEPAARLALGRAPARLPGLSVERIELRQGGAGGEGAEVRLHQRLPDGALLTLVQSRAEPRQLRARAATAGAPQAAKAAAADAPADAPVTLLLDGLVVRATGPIPPDSLRALLGRVR